MPRYSVGQWAGGAAHRIGTTHPAGEARHWISCRGLTRCIRQPDSYLLCILSCWFQWEASQKSPLVLGPFPCRYQSAAAACRRLQRLSSQLHTRKKLFDLCEFHLAAARGACGRSACTVRQRAIKSRRSGKSRLDGFTLMSCVARKFEGKGERKNTKHPHDTENRCVFKVLISSLRLHKEKEVTQLFTWKSCYLVFHQLHCGEHGAALSTKEISLYCNCVSLLRWFLPLQSFCGPCFHRTTRSTNGSVP